MRAAQVVSLDGPSAVEVREIPEPSPGPGEMLVDVHATGIGFPDLLLSKGMYQLKPELPFTLGVDFAGVVRIAPSGTGFAPGDRVAGWSGIGAAAESIALAPDNVFPLPAPVPFEVGAALPLNYLTARCALLTRGGLRAGESVLVTGAGGGLGTALVETAVALGATVLATASSPAKADAARAAGATHVVDVGGYASVVRDLTGGAGVDMVVDMVGSSDAVLDALRSLAPLGRLLILGFVSGEIGSVKLNRLLLNNVDVRGVAFGPYTRTVAGYARAEWDQLAPMVADGRLTPQIGARYPLADVATALADLDERRATGKIILTTR